MLITGERGTPRDSLLAEAGRLESLASDLRLLHRLGDVPPERLSAAPVLEEWQFDVVPSLCACGIVTGHPCLADGPMRTSDAWLIDDRGRWLRSLSRFYVLGQPAKGSGHD